MAGKKFAIYGLPCFSRDMERRMPAAVNVESREEPQ
jgi:hypothetical protein